ncbi:NAD(P)-dependent oxidoreductase, partial [Salmonella enterica subsp. enterica serovar Anatum]|nr:NAD(P)-dependent oxidoreductase [Salmonella enterica subsp. enterica serovar Anatum]
QTPVKQLIFLSSLQAPTHEQSDHLRARQLTADTLRDAGVPVTRTLAPLTRDAIGAMWDELQEEDEE